MTASRSSRLAASAAAIGVMAWLIACQRLARRRRRACAGSKDGRTDVANGRASSVPACGVRSRLSCLPRLPCEPSREHSLRLAGRLQSRRRRSRRVELRPRCPSLACCGRPSPRDSSRSHGPGRRRHLQPRRQARRVRERGSDGADLARFRWRARARASRTCRTGGVGRLQQRRRFTPHGRRPGHDPRVVDGELEAGGRARPDTIARARAGGLLQSRRPLRRDARLAGNGSNLAQRRRPPDPEAEERRERGLQSS